MSCIQKKRVKILIEFEIVANDDGDELTQNLAKSAAAQAAGHHLCLTNNGLDVEGRVVVHVDGFGECDVLLVE